MLNLFKKEVCYTIDGVVLLKERIATEGYWMVGGVFIGFYVDLSSTALCRCACI
jgi:hypothetical protein